MSLKQLIHENWNSLQDRKTELPLTQDNLTMTLNVSKDPFDKRLYEVIVKFHTEYLGDQTQLSVLQGVAYDISGALNKLKVVDPEEPFIIEVNDIGDNTVQDPSNVDISVRELYPLEENVE